MLDSGLAHSCAIVGGAAKCWGYGGGGNLGNGGVADSANPEQVTGLESGVTAISTGSHHACALVNGGAVKCWGDHTWGQLGNAELSTVYGHGSSSYSSPHNVTGLDSGVTAISTGVITPV